MKKKIENNFLGGKTKGFLALFALGGFILGCSQSQNNNKGVNYQTDNNGTRVIAYENSNVEVEENHVESYMYSHATQDTWEVVAGNKQSPIHIRSNDVSPMMDSGVINVYKTVNLKSVTDEKTTLFAEANATTTINGRSFDLLQFHLHSPAEHIIDGVTYDLELHFVHASQSGRLAVLGVMIKEGNHNPAFQVVLDALNDSSKSVENFDVTPLFPKNLNYFHYLGSLTTPPLAENVEWHVFADPIEISTEQLDIYRSHQHYNNTARNTAPLNNRVVVTANATGR